MQYVKQGNIFQKINKSYIKSGGVFLNHKKSYVKVGGVYQEYHSDGPSPFAATITVDRSYGQLNANISIHDISLTGIPGILRLNYGRGWREGTGARERLPPDAGYAMFTASLSIVFETATHTGSFTALSDYRRSYNITLYPK